MMMLSAAVGIILSLLSAAVNGCPFLRQPVSLNISQGTVAQFTVTACSGPGPVLWSIDNTVYHSAYNIGNISVVQTTLANGSVQSVLSIATSSFSAPIYSMISSTVFAPQAVLSDVVQLRIQGLLGAVSDLSYNSTNSLLTWTAPITLAGVPITSYTVNITASSVQLLVITTETEWTVVRDITYTACTRYELSVSPVNSVGIGTHSSISYTHVGVPAVNQQQVTVMINKQLIAANISYEVDYSCMEQYPVSVYSVLSTDEELSYTALTDNVTGIYLIDGLRNDSHYRGKLIFELESGATVETRGFEFNTFDLSTVNILAVNDSTVCVTVSYTDGSEAKGFFITILGLLNGQYWTIPVIRSSANNTYCGSISINGRYLVRVYEWESDGSISGRWREESNVTISISIFPTIHYISSAIPSMSGMRSSEKVMTTMPSPTSDVIATTTVTVITNPESANNRVGVAISISAALLLVVLIAALTGTSACFIIMYRRRKNSSGVLSVTTQWYIDNDYQERTNDMMRQSMASTAADTEDHDHPSTWMSGQSSLVRVSTDPSYTRQGMTSNTTDSTGLSEKAYLTELETADFEEPHSSHGFVSNSLTAAREPTSSETSQYSTGATGATAGGIKGTTSSSHYADLDHVYRRARPVKSSNSSTAVHYSVVSGRTVSSLPKKKDSPPYSQQRFESVVINPQPRPPVLHHPPPPAIRQLPYHNNHGFLPSPRSTNNDPGYATKLSTTTSDITDIEQPAQQYYSESQQAQSMAGSYDVLVTSPPANSNLDQLPAPISSTGTHSNYSRKSEGSFSN